MNIQYLFYFYYIYTPTILLFITWFVFIFDGHSVGFKPYEILRFKIRPSITPTLIYMMRHLRCTLKKNTTGPKDVSKELESLRKGDTFKEEKEQEPSPYKLHQHLNIIKNIAKKESLPVFVGLDKMGEPFHINLPALPHLFVSGMSGHGKSSFLFTLIECLVHAKQAVRVKLIDGKLAQFPALKYEKRIQIEVFDNPANSAYEDQISEVQAEINKRNRIFSEARCTTLKEFNKETKGTPLPYLVLIVDEFPRLVIGKDKRTRDAIKASLIDLANAGRSAGIILVLTAQRPTHNVVDNAILSQMGGVLSFRQKTKSDSDRILGDGYNAHLLKYPGQFIYVGRSDVLGQAPLTELTEFECYKDWKKGAKEPTSIEIEEVIMDKPVLKKEPPTPAPSNEGNASIHKQLREEVKIYIDGLLSDVDEGGFLTVKMAGINALKPDKMLQKHFTNKVVNFVLKQSFIVQKKERQGRQIVSITLKQKEKWQKNTK